MLLVRDGNAFEQRISSLQRHVRRSESLDPTSATETCIPFHHTLNTIDRVFCPSDLHTDHVDNLKWLRKKMGEDRWSKRDLIIVAGDISHDLDVFQESISYMMDKCHVFFVNGNHEAWLNRHDKMDSLEKLDKVYDLCRELGVVVDPCLITGPSPLMIMPIQSWYDGSLSFSEDLSKGFQHWPWVDFTRCRWSSFPPRQDQSNFRIPMGLTQHLLERNLPQFQLLDSYSSAAVMTVSHFLPNKQSLPDWLDLEQDTFTLDWLDHGAGDMSAKFSKVAGSALIDDQLRSLNVIGRHIHVFGHSHRPKDFELGGIRYIHNPLGKPRERQLHMVDPQVDFQLVWDTRQGEVPGEQVLRYWDEKGGGRQALWKRLETVRPGRYQRRKRESF